MRGENETNRRGAAQNLSGPGRSRSRTRTARAQGENSNVARAAFEIRAGVARWTTGARIANARAKWATTIIQWRSVGRSPGSGTRFSLIEKSLLTDPDNRQRPGR